MSGTGTWFLRETRLANSPLWMWLAGLLAWGLIGTNILPAQPPQAGSRPDPTVILKAALSAHRGSHPKKPLESLWFKGTVERRTEKGDVNGAEVEQWYQPGKDRIVIVTRIEVTGPHGTSVSIRGFDGRRHFVVIQGRKTIIDGNPSYRNDEADIKQDRELTRFLVEKFLVGDVLRPGDKLTYIDCIKNQKLLTHKISQRTPVGKSTIFYVNARPGEKPFFFGIEYPAHARAPKVNYCFWEFREFGAFTLPKQIKVYENDGNKPVNTVFIKQLEVNASRKPDWAVVRKKN
jgi:hypothetical protein